MRAAIYYAPPPEAELGRLAASWLGRDAFANEATRPPDPDIDPIVAEPARYGFHATMKAPFRLKDGSSLDDLDAGLAAFCRKRQAVSIERLVLRRIDGFLALVPEQQSTGLSDLAASVVRDFDPFRAPLDLAEIARRRPERLSERQRAHLDAWGYPYVFAEFRCHMTLTGRLDDATAERTEAELADRFADFLGQPLAVDGLALFVESEPGLPFQVRSRYDFSSS